MLERTKRGAPVDSANWDMANQLAALNARKDNMMAYTDDLLNGALAAYKALWPGQVPPNNPASLGSNLELSSIRLGEWRDSSE
jgi:predicted RNA polymerase sigma factor